MMKQFSLACILFVLSIVACAETKMDAMFGFYNETGSTSTASKQISGLGAYQISYLKPFYGQFESVISYSVILSSIVTGDVTFGPSFGINYFPVNFADSEEHNFNKFKINLQDSIKPYVGIRFNQRQFSYMKNSYAGFGGVLGSEYQLFNKYNMKTELQMNSYSGSSDAKLSDINFFTGIVFSF